MRTAGRFAIFQSASDTNPLAGAGRVVWHTLILAALGAVISTPAVAQQYRSDPVNDKARMNRTSAQRALKDPASYASDKAKFDEFFQEYYFPAMTGSDPKALEELGKLRSELFARYLWATSNEQLQTDLTTMALKALGPVAVSNGQPSYHPAARYNAILTIGLLDEQYAIEAAANRRPPKPLPRANEVLVTFVGLADKFPPSLLVGALVGLERHAQYHESLSPDAVTKMTDAVLKVATRETPIAGVNREVFRWIQIQAARTLAKLGSVGPDNKVHDALLELIADEKLGIDNRVAVAAQLANVNYEGATIDGQAAADCIFTLSRDLSVDETRRAREFEDMRIGGNYSARPSSYGEGSGGYGGYGRGGGYGGFSGGLDEGVKFERRQVLARVTDLRAGMNAIKPVAPEESQPKIDAIVASINGVITAASDEDTVDLDVVDKVRAMLRTIESNAGSAAVADDAMEEEAFAPPAEADGAEAPAEEVTAPPNDGAPAVEAAPVEAPTADEAQPAAVPAE